MDDMAGKDYFLSMDKIVITESPSEVSEKNHKSLKSDPCNGTFLHSTLTKKEEDGVKLEIKGKQDVFNSNEDRLTCNQKNNLQSISSDVKPGLDSKSYSGENKFVENINLKRDSEEAEHVSIQKISIRKQISTEDAQSDGRPSDSRCPTVIVIEQGEQYKTQDVRAAEQASEESDSEFDFDFDLPAPQAVEPKITNEVTTHRILNTSTILDKQKSSITEAISVPKEGAMMIDGHGPPNSTPEKNTKLVEEMEKDIKTGTVDEDSDAEFDFDLPQSTDTKAVVSDSAPTVVATMPMISKVLHVSSVATSTGDQNSHETASSLTETALSLQVSREKTVSLVADVPDMSDEHQRALQLAEAEWENVHTIVPSMDNSNRVATVVKTSPPISVTELLEHFQNTDFSAVLPKIQMSVNRRGFAALKHILFGPPKLHRSLHSHKQLIFCMAASPFENDNSIHIRMLQTVYRCLTGSKFDAGRYGGHWEDIGFQGNDPSTDLRAVGLLGLLNLVYILRNPKTQLLARDIYKLSQDSTQNFPFCVMSINMSRLVLQSLRKDCLNKECNRREEIIPVINELYAALYLKMYQIWKNQGKTIKDSGFVIKDLKHAVEKNTRDLFQNMDEYQQRKQPQHIGTPDSPGEPDKFISVCDDGVAT